MEIDFKGIVATDLNIVKDIYDWYVQNSTATFHTEPISIDELRQFMFVDHPLYKSYLILADEVVAGYCYLTFFKKRQAYERTAEVTIYLKTDYCGKGIGIKALQHLEAAAKGTAIKNLIAIISGDNAGSIRLFTKAGYEQCSRYKNVGEKFGQILDVVSFQKEL
jgi:L-amino acid N-acyltransferase YncA